jgi:hypothetical protein
MLEPGELALTWRKLEAVTELLLARQAVSRLFSPDNAAQWAVAATSTRRAAQASSAAESTNISHRKDRI